MSELTAQEESRDRELEEEYELFREEWKQMIEHIAEEKLQFEEGNAALEDEVRLKQLQLLKKSRNILTRESWHVI